MADASSGRPIVLVYDQIMRKRRCLSSSVPDGLSQAWALITYNAHVQRSRTMITYTAPRGLRLGDFCISHKSGDGSVVGMMPIAEWNRPRVIRFGKQAG